MSTKNNDMLFGFDALIGQEKPIRLIKAALAKDELPHALLFSGQPGIGKSTTAINIAMSLNCRRNGVSGAAGSMDTGEAERDKGETRDDACGSCRSCRKILSENHPDILRIKPSGAYIRIDQIRTLCSTLALKPYEATVRLVLLSDAHLMNAEAGNALLKILEEPPGNTLFILTVPAAADLLPTIVSRCQHIRFNPIPRDRLETWLAQHFELDEQNAMITASLANGSFGRALILKDTDWVNQRNWIIEEIESIAGQPPGYGLHFSEALARKKEILAYAFEIMKNWFRDLAVVRYCPEKTLNRDLQQRIFRATERLELEQVLEKADIVERCERAIESNANVRLALDAMVLQLAK